MDFLVLLILPALFLLYTSFLKESSLFFTAFLLGLLSGIISLIIVSFFPFSNLAVSPVFNHQLLRFFLQYFLLNSIFGFISFFILAFSIEEEVIYKTAGAFFGIFTSVFTHLFYKNISIPSLHELILFLLAIVSVIFIFDFILKILFKILTITPIIIFFIAFIVSISIMFLSSYIITLWYFSSNTTFYSFILGGLCFISFILSLISLKL